MLLAGCGSGTDKAQPDPPHSSPSAAPPSERLGLAELKAVMPSIGDLPPGWEKSSEPRVEGPDGTKLALVRQGFAAPDLEGIVGLGVYSFETPAKAIKYYTDIKAKGAQVGVQPVELPDVDGAHATSHCIGDDYCSTSIQFRMGSVAARVTINTTTRHPIDARVLNSTARMFAQRIRQAQQGQTPTAKAA
ncbi:hypothetical protein [Streptomyces hydrogenans]|uniref:hypothetical protein n=1 Tax=Streptomyces hydrogenans TaxID=1873719 RepID=UPI00382C2E9A